MGIEMGNFRNVWFYLSQIFNQTHIKTDCYFFGQKYEIPEDKVRLKEDIFSKIYMCYRSGFEAIDCNKKITSDAGWGCMIRCAQMLFANAILTIRLGRSRKWDDDANDEKYISTLSMFFDHPQSLLSIHNFCSGESNNMGNKFGASMSSKIAANIVSTSMDDFVILVWDLELMMGDIKNACLGPDGGWKPAILMIYNQLFSNYLDSCYIETMKKILQIPQCVGILSGTPPDHAVYIVGFHDDKLMYFDPHLVKPVENVTKFNDLSYHTSELYSISFTKIKPSFCFGFLCRSESEYEELMPRLSEVTSTNELFFVSDNATRPDHHSDDCSFENLNMSD